MSQIKITLRQKEILEKICSEYKYITISKIAEGLSISARTVLRELPNIDKWLEPYNCCLDKKSGLGIRLNGSMEARRDVLDNLEEEKELKSYTPKERQIIIISELLQNREPVKIYSFTKLLKVTEGTVSNDLDKIEEWLLKYNLKLIRKPGLGVYIEGQEDSIRRAIINLFYENIDESQLVDLIKENITMLDKEYKALDKDTKNRLLNLIDKGTVKKLEALIFELEKVLGYRFADNAFIGLLVHLTLAIQRIIKNEKISMDKKYLSKLKKYEEYKIAEELAKKISQTFNIEIPEDEVGYVTMHIRGSRGLEASSNNDLDVQSIAKEVIKTAEAETGIFLQQNERLYEGLVNHLGPVINRMKMNMDIRNPLLDEIKEFYPKLFKLASKCSKVVEKYIGMKMPESEIAYIAMHLGAAIEKRGSYGKRSYRTVIVCTTGIGTSVLLAARIEKEYENIEIVEVASTLHLNQDYLIGKSIDFIISTVNIKFSKLPVVVVNPLLFEKDKQNISEFIHSLKDKARNYSEPNVKSVSLKEKLSKQKLYTDAILQLLNNFFIFEKEEIRSVEEIIEIVSGIAVDEENKTNIKLSLKEREEKGSTILTGLNSILLHCRTKGVEELYFGAVRIKQGLSLVNAEDEKENIRLAIIMLAPDNCNKEYIEAISFISTKFIEEPEFIEALLINSRDDLYMRLNEILDEFYRMKK
ncbi:BglG family transcription antiterminator [Clostridium sp. YIM B02515]|uniref:BglG family transcription antiterminator n=1 Tax=Clostridium rhizosphaerae TaxID=2803861 RepID=A0ABS1T549_9CLOT|nr:BglG family transcription antiterminator [Clostridium rhizosphaerae]MBL4934450.1 BglG family transcription antiterminator [Clostridium rhizosphaerae]